MGRDTIQLENAVSTISQEYLLEFTFEYGIPEGLYPELPGPEEMIVDFAKGKVGRDTIQLENAVSTISQEYLLEFTFEYGIPEGLYPELPGPEEMIVEFPKGKIWILFNLISSLNPTKVKTGTCPCTAHEVPLLTVTTSRMIDMEDVAMASESSGTLSTIEKTPSTTTKNVNDPEPLSYAKPQSHLEQDVTSKSSKGTATEIPTEYAATAGVNVLFSSSTQKQGLTIDPKAPFLSWSASCSTSVLIYQ
nr:hypothetical protein [Tanacetum cinerariifolium]